MPQHFNPNNSLVPDPQSAPPTCTSWSRSSSLSTNLLPRLDEVTDGLGNVLLDWDQLGQQSMIPPSACLWDQPNAGVDPFGGATSLLPVPRDREEVIAENLVTETLFPIFKHDQEDHHCSHHPDAITDDQNHHHGITTRLIGFDSRMATDRRGSIYEPLGDLCGMMGMEFETLSQSTTATIPTPLSSSCPQFESNLIPTDLNHNLQQQQQQQTQQQLVDGQFQKDDLLNRAELEDFTQLVYHGGGSNESNDQNVSLNWDNQELIVNF
ncbi:hypothetical protein BY996DRAFT_8083170 [Phakopsora pachyrhizi]|nr:hypothetical protein BY996DRAFT_8083170 [Phakopsora pachyrhizi]